MLYYSKSTGGFYDTAIHGDIPANAVEITAAEHAALLAAQASGQSIQAGEDGRPVAVTVLPALDAMIAAKTAAIQTAKCAARDAGFKVDGVLFDSDQAARLAYMEFALSVAQDASYTQAAWKASEGVWVSMDATLFATVKTAGEAAIAAAFAWQQARDAEVAAIKTAVAAGTMTEADARTALAAVSTTYTATTEAAAS